MKGIDRLEDIRRKAMEKISVLQEKREKKLIPLLEKKYIGKCFKYHNSYGGDRPKWWLYAKCTGVNSINFHNNEEPILKTLQVEQDCNGKIQIENCDYGYLLRDEWVPISNKEYSDSVNTIKANFINMVDGKQTTAPEM